MSRLHQLVAIVLLSVFGLPVIQSLYALTPKSEASLPACCRRDGKHHCMMSMAERNQLASHGPQFQAPEEKCPYCPAAPVALVHRNFFLPSEAQAIYVGLAAHTVVCAQMKCWLRIARDRAHGKRGPPVPSRL